MTSDLMWELVTYRKALPVLLAQQGQWVLIHQSEVVGVWPSSEEALSEGYRQYGETTFLVKQICAFDPVDWAPWAHTDRDVPVIRIPPTPQYLIAMRCPEGVVYPNSVEGESPVNQPEFARKFQSPGDAQDWAAARPELLDGYTMTVERIKD